MYRTLFGGAASAAAVALTILVGTAPAIADDGFGARIEGVLNDLPDEYSVFTDASGDRAVVPIEPATGLLVVGAAGETLRVHLPSTVPGEQGTPLRDGAVAHDNGDGSATVPVPKADGSVQIVTVIEAASAPEKYRFELDLPNEAVIERGEDGSLAVISKDGEFVAGVAAPWALDAEGAQVPTRYEVDGAALVQIVEHDSGSFVHPIVADPWLGIDLYGTPTVTFPSGGYSINVTPTYWGETWSGVDNVAMWWAHRDEVVTKLGSSSWRWTTSIQEQFYCHIAGYPLGLPVYNMESWRPLVYWETSLVVYQCNP